MTADVWMETLASTGRFSAPLMLAAMGGLFSERSGVIQMALEGFMLVGAFVAACVAFQTNNGALGLCAGALSSLVFAAVYGALVITLKADQVVSGTVMNMLAWGGIPVFSKAMFGMTAKTPSLTLDARLADWWPITLGLLAILLTIYMIKKTPVGLWITFAGESPEALKAVGIRPSKVRWIAVLTAGAFAGVGGAVLSICLSSGYTKNMVAGRGFMALAALILGKWRPWPTMLSCLLFGAFDVLQLKLQGVELFGLGVIPVQWVQVLPYILTLVILATGLARSQAPAKLGEAS